MITKYLQDSMIEWRHEFHRYPEVGFEETKTATKIAALLNKWGIETHCSVGGTGVVGVLKRGSNERAIGLRADMDALEITEQNTFEHRSRVPGKMHACGHDGHITMLLGAAKHLAKESNFDGKVVFIFQPAEEHGRGAKAMITDRLFERFPVQDVYALHNFPSLPKGQFVIINGPAMASEDNFEIVIKGVGHHAAMPHRGIDPIVVASQIVLAFQTIISRSINPMEGGVISVTEFITDGTVNVVPTTVTLRGDTRSFNSEVQLKIKTSMKQIAESICTAFGITCDFHYKNVFDSTINTPNETSIAINVAKEVIGAKNVTSDFRPPMSSEDFAFMLKEKPGCYILLGNDKEGIYNPGLHSPGYDFNDEILSIGADFWVRLVESQLTAK